MNILLSMIHALLHHDYAALANPDLLWIIYSFVFVILLLENGLLPAAFLPGDSLLFLCGALIGRGVMDFTTCILLLSFAASLGCWLGYLQGRLLKNSKITQRWLKLIPEEYHQRAWNMFNQHGMKALITGRFLAFIRTLLPVMAGIAGLAQRRFHFYNIFSGVFWVGTLISLGYAVSSIPLFHQHEKIIMTVLMLIPVSFVIIGLVGIVLMVLKKEKC